MNNKNLLLSYLLIIPAIFLLLFFNSNFWIWLICAILLLIYPIIYSLLNRSKISVLTTTIVLFLVILNLFIGLCIGYNRFNSYTEIASTDDIKKANEIEDVISSYYCDSIRIVKDKLYIIALKNNDKIAYKEIVLSLINNNDIVGHARIRLNSSSVAFSKSGLASKFKKDAEKELPYLINGIKGVYNSKINVEYSKCFFEKECANPYVKANVKIDINEYFDTEEIKELTEKLLLATVAGLTKDDIHIEFNIEPCSEEDECYNHKTTQQLYKKVKYYYEMKDYSNTIKYLEKAKKMDDSYSSTIKDVKNIMKLNREIKKNPNNYKLYIQRGDIENVFDNPMFEPKITSDYHSAIADYTQALKLNPKAYEVYERRGDAWAEYGYQPCYSCKTLRTRQEDENVIKDYELAIRYLGGNDRLYEKLGDRYIENNPQKALEYYNKVQNLYYVNSNSLPMPDFSDNFTISKYDILPLKIVRCYSELEEYDKALDMLFEINKNYNNKTIIKRVNNLRFYYNWKAKHYKSALKNADSCSVWVCKVLGIFF